MKTMCLPGYHQNSFVATHALENMMYGYVRLCMMYSTRLCTSCTVMNSHHVPKCMNCHKAIVVITERAHCFHDCIYITPIFIK